MFRKTIKVRFLGKGTFEAIRVLKPGSYHTVLAMTFMMLPPRVLLSAACLWLFSFTLTFGQLRLHPVQRHEQGYHEKNKSNARAQSLPAMSLPFWDDFSFPTGDAPQDTLWENSRSVWISSDMAINTPSINAATFDGLDSLGMPVSLTQTVGFTDKLVSRPIKLGTAEVPEALRNTVYFSFHYQWQGNGEAPDPSDFLQLDFKNDQDTWEEILKILPKNTFDRTVFYDTILRVNGNQFFHDTFQFRFRRYGRQSGPFDTWNLDYVYLNKLRNAIDFAYPDAALASPLTTLLNEYRSVPVKHFFASKQFSKPQFDVQNLRNISGSYLYHAIDTITNFMDAPPPKVFADTLVKRAGIFDNGSGFMEPKERATTTLKTLPDATDNNQFDSLAKEIRTKLFIKFVSNDVYDSAGNVAVDYDVAKYYPIDFRVNDTLSFTYIMKDYYAYDDGTAEYSVDLTKPSNMALYEYNMITPDPDTLIGFDVYFPPFGITNNQAVDLIVYGPDPENDTKPGPKPLLTINRTITPQGINQFFSTSVIPSLLVQKRFFIGWVQPPIGTPKVGLDYSGDSGDKIWVNANGSWIRNPDDVYGNLMIRARFGKGEVITGLPEETEAFKLYPNPTSGAFFISDAFELLGIRNLTGQSLNFTETHEGSRKRIYLEAAPGLYLLHWRKGTVLGTQKIVIVR